MANVAARAERQQVNFTAQLRVMPPRVILDVYEQLFGEHSNLFGN